MGASCSTGGCWRVSPTQGGAHRAAPAGSAPGGGTHEKSDTNAPPGSSAQPVDGPVWGAAQTHESGGNSEDKSEGSGCGPVHELRDEVRESQAQVGGEAAAGSTPCPSSDGGAPGSGTGMQGRLRLQAGDSAKEMTPTALAKAPDGAVVAPPPDSGVGTTRPALAAPVLQEACSVTGRTHEQLLEDAKGTRGVRGVSYVSPSSKGGEFRQRFKVGQTLGRGAFSTVKLATNRETKAKFAVKIMNTGPGGKASLVIAKRELAILRKLSHEAIMKVEAAFEEGGKMYIVSELLPGGELLQSLVNRGTYTEQDARACFEKLALALAHIHAKGIVHRDIKLENLMLKEPGDVTSVQLIDFGMAKHVDIPELSTSVVGTPIYVAPEVLTAARQAGVNPYRPPVDMWSAGVVLHILLAGYPPFMSDSEPELFNLIRAASFSMDDAVWASVSPEAKALLHGLLEPDTSKRLTAAQVLAHPWFTGTQNAVLSGALANMANTLAQKLRSVMRSAVLAGSAALRRMSSHRRFSTTDTPSNGATTSAHNPLSPRPVLTRAINSVPRFQSRGDDPVESPDVRHNNMKLSLHRRTQSMKQR